MYMQYKRQVAFLLNSFIQVALGFTRDYQKLRYIKKQQQSLKYLQAHSSSKSIVYKHQKPENEDCCVVNLKAKIIS